MPDRADWEKLVGKQRTERDTARRPMYEMIAQAAVKAEQLTGDPNWNRYLELLQAMKEKTVEHRASWDAILHNAAVVNSDSISKARIGYLECQARIETLEAVMALPRELIEAGDEAKQVLESIGEPET